MGQMRCGTDKQAFQDAGDTPLHRLNSNIQIDLYDPNIPLEIRIDSIVDKNMILRLSGHRLPIAYNAAQLLDIYYTQLEITDKSHNKIMGEMTDIYCDVSGKKNNY